MRWYVKTKSSKTGIIIKVLWILAVLVSIKTVFTDFGGDNAYSMAMSYRHITGDRMFLEMWEPHQTSIFLTDFLMWVYGLVVPSFTGVAVYLQVCGTLFFALIAVFLFKEIKALSGNTAAHLATIFFLIFRAKQTVFPEFSNVSLGFSVIMFLLLWRYLEREGKTVHLVLAALALCLEALAYPSCILSAIPAVIIIAVYSRRKLKDIVIFLLTCAVVGASYVGFFVFRIGPARFLECLKAIVNSDSHANTTFVGGFGMYRGVVIALAWIAASLLISFIIRLFFKRRDENESGFLEIFGIVFFATGAIMLLLQKKTGIDWTCSIYIIPALLCVMCLLKIKKLSDGGRRFFVMGVLISLSSALGAMLLTDLGYITSLAFLTLAGTVAFVMVDETDIKGIAGVSFILAAVLFSRGLVVWGYSNSTGGIFVTDLQNYVRNGPTKWLLTDHMTCYMTRDNGRDIAENVLKEDKTLLVEGWLFDSSVFMLLPGEISNLSVIDTPYYNEEVPHYFEVNPGKMPTVVMVRCWFGQMGIDEESEIMRWVNSHYEPTAEGNYYRFYRRKAE